MVFAQEIKQRSRHFDEIVSSDEVRSNLQERIVEQANGLLANAGFGLWCDSPSVELLTSFDTAEALQALDYDVSNTEAAIRAFKFHFTTIRSMMMNEDFCSAY
jgi:hypothetical protein